MPLPDSALHESLAARDGDCACGVTLSAGRLATGYHIPQPGAYTSPTHSSPYPPSPQSAANATASLTATLTNAALATERAVLTGAGEGLLHWGPRRPGLPDQRSFVSPVCKSKAHRAVCRPGHWHAMQPLARVARGPPTQIPLSPLPPRSLPPPSSSTAAGAVSGLAEGTRTASTAVLEYSRGNLNNTLRLVGARGSVVWNVVC